MQLDFYSASQLRKRDGSKDKGKVEIGFLTTLWYTKEKNIWTRVSRILSSPGVFNGSAAMRSLFHTKKNCIFTPSPSATKWKTPSPNPNHGSCSLLRHAFFFSSKIVIPFVLSSLAIDPITIWEWFPWNLNYFTFRRWFYIPIIQGDN